MNEAIRLLVVFWLGFLCCSLMIERERRKSDRKKWHVTNRRKTDLFKLRLP